MLALTAAPASAQDNFEFEDPLAQVRAKVEKIEAQAGGDRAALATVGAQAEAPAAETPDVKDPLARISERLGLPVLGLVALAGLALLALLLGFLWLMMRLRYRRSTKPVDRELYAVDDGTRGRRQLESGVMARRKPANESKSTDYGKVALGGSAAAAAAAIISDDDDRDLDHDNDAYDLVDEDVAAQGAEQLYHTETESPAETDASDPSSWRRPNLDRLKASIRDDWHSDKEETAAEAAEEEATEDEPEEQIVETAAVEEEEAQSPLRREAENFASLFGDDDGAPAVADDETPLFSEGLGSRRKEGGSTMLSELRSTIEKTADITPAEALEKRRAELPSREEAMRRIKALRDSVKAS